MSNPIPNLLALTSIGDGSAQQAAPIRNNFAAVQTAVNENIAALTGGASGQFLEAVDASDVKWAYPPGHEFSVAQPAAANYTVGTAIADLLTFPDFTPDGEPVYVELSYTPLTNSASVDTLFVVTDAANTTLTPNTVVAPGTVFARWRLTPSAVVKSGWKIRWSSGSGTSGMNSLNSSQVIARIVKA